MPTVYPTKPRQKSTSTLPTDASRQSLSEPLSVLTKDGQPSPSSLPRADGLPVYTQTTNQPLKRTLNANGNDPQLLAEIFKPTVDAMRALNMLTVVKTPSGKLAIILPTDMFNDDLTLKIANTVGNRESVGNGKA